MDAPLEVSFSEKENIFVFLVPSGLAFIFTDDKCSHLKMKFYTNSRSYL